MSAKDPKGSKSPKSSKSSASSKSPKDPIVGGKLVGTKEEILEKAARGKRARKYVFKALAGEDRAQRVLAARVIHELAALKPEELKEYNNEMAAALELPEAQSRWEILGALEKMVAVDARVCDRSIVPATTALHDAESGVVRLAAFRMIAAYGATTVTRSEKIWPLLDEAIRIYHGDPEFANMLSGVYRLMQGEASDAVKMAAADRMEFDAEHTKGVIGRRAKRIVQAAPKRRRRKKKPEETA